MIETSLSVLVPASTSNLGAGFDCLGVALDLWLEARIVPGDGSPSYRGTLVGLTPDQDIIHELVQAVALPGHRLVVRSDIPVATGLGSSAAATVAGLVLAALLRGETPNKDVIYQEAVRREGHPDNAGPAVYGGAVLAVRWSGPSDASGDDTEPRTIAFAENLGFAVAVPEQSINTAEARKLLPDHVNRSLAVGQASRAAALVTGLQQGDGDLIAVGMEDLIAVPARSSLIKGYDAACGAGIEAGAYGVTISGSGASLVAVTPRERAVGVAEAMAEALTRSGNAAEAYAPAVSNVGLSWRSEEMV